MYLLHIYRCCFNLKKYKNKNKVCPSLLPPWDSSSSWCHWAEEGKATPVLSSLVLSMSVLFSSFSLSPLICVLLDSSNRPSLAVDSDGIQYLLVHMVAS